MPARKLLRKSTAAPQHYWAAMEEEEELHGLVCAVDRSLADCLQLLQEVSFISSVERWAVYFVFVVREGGREGERT